MRRFYIILSVLIVLSGVCSLIGLLKGESSSWMSYWLNYLLVVTLVTAGLLDNEE